MTLRQISVILILVSLWQINSYIIQIAQYLFLSTLNLSNIQTFAHSYFIITRLEFFCAMTQSIDLASKLLILTTFVFESSISLYEMIRSFQSHQQRVCNLVNKLSALSAILNSLTEIIHVIFNIDFSALEVSLLRCDNACKDFEKKLLKCSSWSTNTHTSFRDWIKLRYMREDIDDFRWSLIEYKLIISIAFTNAHL